MNVLLVYKLDQCVNEVNLIKVYVHYLWPRSAKPSFYPDEALMSFLSISKSMPDGEIMLNILSPSCVVFMLVYSLGPGQFLGT